MQLVKHVEADQIVALIATDGHMLGLIKQPVVCSAVNVECNAI